MFQFILDKLKPILDWSEVWALLIPLAAHQLLRYQPHSLRPVVVYLWGALILNLIGDIIMAYRHSYLPDWLQTNVVIYNVHCLFRYICFVYFFRFIKQTYFTRFGQLLPFLFLIIVVANFYFLENFFGQDHIAGNLFTIEAYFLLIHCLLYYLSQLREEVERLQENKEFWIVTGLSIYVVMNFFIFLFYVPMIRENAMLANQMWDVHNLAYITLCLFITKAIYVPLRPDH
jgi:hypothetical protein